MRRKSNKDNVLTHKYRKKDGTCLCYNEVRDMILAFLSDDKLDMTPTDITRRLGFEHRQLTHILPHLANEQALTSYRTSSDQLLYTRRKPNLLQETYYPTGKIEDLIKEGKLKVNSRVIHRAK